MTVEELNEAVKDGSVNEFVRVVEARQRKTLSRIADEICSRPNVRVVLISGASSAGKTTTATRLCTQLRVNDAHALHISTDDYFVGDKLNPRDENGELDYEHVKCVDIEKMVEDLKALVAGDTVKRRRFDFARHEGYYTDECMSAKDGYVVVEGIHALNPMLSEGLDDSLKYRLFVDPDPDLKLFMDLTVDSAHSRLMRRMVRDRQFRKVGAAETLRMWPKVLAGEEKWIKPFRAEADRYFNSYLTYELAVLKPYVAGLLELARRELGETREIAILQRIIAMVSPLSSNVVPGDSILRETIGNSQLEY